MKFSDNLRNMRIQRGMTQMELAEGLRTSQSAITSWENGKREPDFKTIERIADYFNVPISTLLPSNDNVDSDSANIIAEAIQQNQKLKVLFDKLRFMPDKTLDVFISVAEAFTFTANKDA